MLCITDLPIEILSRILLELAYTDLLILSSVAKIFHDFRTDAYFWSEKASHDLNSRKSQFYRLSSNGPITRLTHRSTEWTEMTAPDQRYVELVTRSGYVTLGSERYLELRRCFLRAIRRNYLHPLTESHDRALVRYFQQRIESTTNLTPSASTSTSTSYIWVAARNEAALYQRVDLMATCIDKLSAPEWTENNLECLAMAGAKPLIDSYIETHSSSSDSLLYGAVIGGHWDLVDDALHRGATNLEMGLELAITYHQSNIATRLLEMITEPVTHPGESLPLGRLLKLALRNGEWSVFSLLTQKFSDRIAQLLDESTSEVTWNDFLSYGVQYGYTDLITLAIDHGATNWNLGLIESAKVNDITLADYFIKQGATQLDEALTEACHYGHGPMVTYLRSINPTIDTNVGLLAAIRSDHWNLIEELLTDTSTYDAIETACNTGHLDILDLVVEKLSPTPRHLQPALIRAIINQHGHLVNYLLHLGANPTVAITEWINLNPIAHRLHDLSTSMMMILMDSRQFMWTIDLLENLNTSPVNYLQSLIESKVLTRSQALHVLFSQRSRSQDQDAMMRQLLLDPTLDPSILLTMAQEYDDLDALIWIHDLIVSKPSSPQPVEAST
jgi:hypothetical protein